MLCTSATITTIDDVSAGFRSSLTIGSDGLALISYSDRANNNLKVAHCSNVACTSVVKTTVNSTADQVGYDTSITIGVDGLGIISYYNTTKDDLEVLHCSNTLCTPHVRRR